MAGWWPVVLAVQVAAWLLVVLVVVLVLVQRLRIERLLQVTHQAVSGAAALGMLQVRQRVRQRALLLLLLLLRYHLLGCPASARRWRHCCLL